ncbi:hypothetical protein CRENBAI_006495 [Crenichthys baileyi]|uniref:Uncharacterized protein n=1 Tax=Crenichthys baileyi TaxID=28760 RepID=A0AAV9QQF4_9TELE
MDGHRVKPLAHTGNLFDSNTKAVQEGFSENVLIKTDDFILKEQDKRLFYYAKIVCGGQHTKCLMEQPLCVYNKPHGAVTPAYRAHGFRR